MPHKALRTRGSQARNFAAMSRTLSLAMLACSAAGAFGQIPFVGNTTPTHGAVIGRYTELAADHAAAQLFVVGKDDGGQPLHLFVIHDGGPADPEAIRRSGKNILFILNGIHPGEPDGIDASMMLAQQLLESDQLGGLLVHTAVCIVPIYNVSGAQMRNSFSRANQNGPESYGFRANAIGLDLNRDMMKMDSRNAQTLVPLLRRWDPDVFLDTHVSNGADHRYVMELLTTRKEKLAPAMGEFMARTLVPGLYDWMEGKDIPMCPYFETRKEVPDSGLMGFHDGPRYTTGYTALFQTIGIMAESHMLKPYAQRVNATHQLMLGILAVMDREHTALADARREARRQALSTTTVPLRWTLDTTVVEELPFKGYRAEHVPSAVSGLPRLRYDTTAPVDLVVPWMDHYRPERSTNKPKAYLVPQQWRDVIQRLVLNQVRLDPILRDTVLTGAYYRIEDYRTVATPHEGRYLHHEVKCSAEMAAVRARAGDMLVHMGTEMDAYVTAALEPEAEDSFFAWGFFDAVLQQKEWFSPYVFEDIAAELLATDAAMRKQFDARRAGNPGFAEDAMAQLLFIYRHSKYMEPGYMRYPIARIF